MRLSLLQGFAGGLKRMGEVSPDDDSLLLKEQACMQA